MEKIDIEKEIFNDIKFNNKIIKYLLFLIIIIIILILFGSFYLYMNKLVTPTVIEINLLDISTEEKENLKNMNFLELDIIPNSINFISLKLESNYRENQL